MTDPTPSSRFDWRLRSSLGLIMITLSFVGLIITNIRDDLAWDYWRILAIVFAVISLALSWLLHRQEGVLTFKLVWQELALWSGLLLSVYLVTILEKLGHISRFGASLEILTLLALTLFCVGIFVERTFLPVGILLGLLAATFGVVTQYRYFVVVPLVLVAIIALYFLVKRKRVS